MLFFSRSSKISYLLQSSWCALFSYDPLILDESNQYDQWRISYRYLYLDSEYFITVHISGSKSIRHIIWLDQLISSLATTREARQEETVVLVQGSEKYTMQFWHFIALWPPQLFLLNTNSCCFSFSFYCFSFLAVFFYPFLVICK